MILNIAGAETKLFQPQPCTAVPNLFAVTLPKFEIKTLFVNPDEPGDFERSFQIKQKLSY